MVFETPSATRTFFFSQPVTTLLWKFVHLLLPVRFRILFDSLCIETRLIDDDNSNNNNNNNNNGQLYDALIAIRTTRYTTASYRVK